MSEGFNRKFHFALRGHYEKMLHEALNEQKS